MARQRGNRWLADVRTSQGRLRLSFRTQEEAEKWEAEALEADRQGKPLPSQFKVEAPKPKGRSAPSILETLGPLADYVAKHEWLGTKGEKTALINSRDVVNYFGSNKPVAEIGLQEVHEMRAHFAEKGLSAATVNRKTAALSKMLNTAHDLGIVQSVPRIKWKQEVKTRFRYLDQREEKLMLAFWKAHNEPDMHDFCVLLIDTGARAFSEMAPVKWEHFAANFAAVTFWETKTGQPRTVPLTARCRAILEARRAMPHLKVGPFSGITHGGSVENTMNKHTTRHKWDVMREITGLHDVTPHTLRHTCCSRLILGGADVKRVMTWMGHTSITTTMRYMQIKPDSLGDILGILESAA